MTAAACCTYHVEVGHRNQTHVRDLVGLDDRGSFLHPALIVVHIAHLAARGVHETQGIIDTNGLLRPYLGIVTPLLLRVRCSPKKLSASTAVMPVCTRYAAIIRPVRPWSTRAVSTRESEHSRAKVSQRVTNLARLAVDASHVVRVFQEPLHIGAELRDHLQHARVVVVEREPLHQREAVVDVVRPLAAQIVNLVVPLVTLLEEPLHLGERVPVCCFRAHGREPHGDELRSHIREVEVEPVLLEPLLLFRHQAAKAFLHGARLNPVDGWEGQSQHIATNVSCNQGNGGTLHT